MSEIIIEVPAYPPSANAIWRNGKHGTYLTQQAKDFNALVHMSCRHQLPSFLSYPVEIEILLTMKDRRQRDVDNVNKVVVDALRKAKLLEDDSWKFVRRVSSEIERISDNNIGTTIIKIKKYNGDDL